MAEGTNVRGKFTHQSPATSFECSSPLGQYVGCIYLALDRDLVNQKRFFCELAAGEFVLFTVKLRDLTTGAMKF